MQSQRNHSILFLFLLFGFSAFGGFAPDSSEHTSYLEGEYGQQILDPLKFNVDQLNECLFHAINEYRLQKKKSVFSWSEPLTEVALHHQKTYEHKKFFSFERMFKKFSKNLLQLAQMKGYKGGLVTVSARGFNIIDYNNKPFFYERRDQVSDLHLFYGDRKKVKSDADKKPIPYYTFAKLSRSIVRQMIKSERKAKNMDKAYRDIGLYTMLDYKSLYRRGIPQIKVVIIYGGYQTDLLKDLVH